MYGMDAFTPPERVARFFEVVAAPTRVIVLRIVMEKTRTYNELFDLIDEDVMSRGSVYEALRDLKRWGYVEDDAPENVRRRSKRTTFWANKDIIADDLGATVAYFAS
jgi:DNA-binding transcriptional ArsR family regulator